MRNAASKPSPGIAEAHLWDSHSGEEIAAWLIKIRVFLLEGAARGYLDRMQEIDELLLDLASYFTELDLEPSEEE